MVATYRSGSSRRALVAAVQLAARGIDEAERSLEDSLAAIAEAGRAGAELVVLPECTWPGYLIGDHWQALWDTLPSQDDVLERWAAAAAEAGVVLVAGAALQEEDGLYNVAIVLDRDGTVAGRAAKRFLWDFDQRCFLPGTDLSVVQTSLGRLGLIICADGRMPEIARVLALQGAELLVSPTAWVTAGADPQRWTNPQFEFMLPTRARENGLWAVAANKVGIEREAVAYCGRSSVIDAHGRLVQAGPTGQPAITVAVCEISSATPPVARRPELYGELVRGTDSLAVMQRIARPVVPAALRARIVVDATNGSDDQGLMTLCEQLKARLVVGRRPQGNPVSATPLLVLETPARAALRSGGAVKAIWSATHGPGASNGPIGPVAEISGFGVAAMVGDDGLVPECSRTLMLAGADLIVWFPSADGDVRGIAATRAAENRIFVVVSSRPDAVTPSCVLDPNGRVLAEAGVGGRLLTPVVSLSEARCKEIAPGTDAVGGRQPERYGPLVA